MPHYLKLLRYYFLDKGFLLRDGTIDSGIVKEVLENDKWEISFVIKTKITDAVYEM